MVDAISFESGGKRAKVYLNATNLRPNLRFEKIGNGDCSEDGNYSHYDEKFDQREPFARRQLIRQSTNLDRERE